ncbi:hypothetical protein V492_02785 [Pseudogymnoascus sp. VKM F-4246]|nr:hypothetical protein V492_02785 [Pseudogymnoascus sp. VKM F-4246]
MAPRPPISSRPLPQVRGTPMNPGALTTQLNTHGTVTATSTETQTMLNHHQHAQVQRIQPTSEESRPVTPPSSMSTAAAEDVVTQMRTIIENLERQPPTAGNRAQAAAMARNLADLREKMDAVAQPRLSADAPEFTPSPSQERGRPRAPVVGNDRDSAGGANPLNQGGVVVPTFTFTSVSPGQPQQYTQEETQTQITAIFGSSVQNNVPQLPVVNGSVMASFHGHMEPITINPVTGRPRTPLSHLEAISNNARRRSQERAERAEREAAAQAQLDHIIQQDEAHAQQTQQAQQMQTQHLQQLHQAQAQQAQAHQLQQAQAQAQAHQLQQVQAQQAQAQQLQQAQARAFQAYQARQAYQGQQPPQQLQVQQPQPHQPHHFQNQQPSNGQIFSQIQQNLQFAPQQPQQQFPFGVNDMSYGPPSQSHMHTQQQMGNDFAFNNMQDFSQGPPVPPFMPQSYDNASMGQFQAQPVTQQHQNMVFNNVNQSSMQPETQNGVALAHTPDVPIPTGANNVTAEPPVTEKFRDTPPQTQSGPVANGPAEDDVAGYFPSAYELTGKWHTLPVVMRTPPQTHQQQNGWDKTRKGDGPGSGGSGPNNGAAGDANGNGNGRMPLPTAKNDQNGKTHSRGPSQGSSTHHKNGNTRPNASHTWRSHQHTISGDFTTLKRNAGHLDLLGSPAFPVSASEYAGLRADAIAEKQARLTAQLNEMIKMKGEQRVGEAMGGKALYGYSAVLAEKENVWSVDGSGGESFPSVAEMKRELALVVAEMGSLSGSPGRCLPKPKGMVPGVNHLYVGVDRPNLALAEGYNPALGHMAREDWSVKSAERLKALENERAWREIVDKASKEAALKVNQIPKNDSELLVGRGLLDRLV